MITLLAFIGVALGAVVVAGLVATSPNRQADTMAATATAFGAIVYGGFAVLGVAALVEWWLS